MNRRKFVQHSCVCGVTGYVAGQLLTACVPSRYSAGTIRGSDMYIPVDDFIYRTGEETRYRKYVMAGNSILKFPVCVFRFSESDYQALWTECTHQGNEVQVFGETLECPAHGSVFDARGQVRQGPAARPLRSFPVIIEGDYLKISLRK